VGRSGFLYLDSDLFILHAGAGLLPDLIAVAGFELPDARRLRPLPYMLRKGRIPRVYSAGAIEKASAWCPRIPPIDTSPSADLLDQLLTVPGIDAGEAFLFALAAESDSLVGTGDKRACAALYTSNCRAKNLLRGKILCFETVLRLLLEKLEFLDLAKRLAPAREHNQTLRVLLSQGEQTSEAQFIDGLRSCSLDLERQAGNLLFRPSPL